jgi:PAS domain S-box-containing protein
MSDASIHILHVDDESDLADLTRTFLEREDERFVVQTAQSVADALDRIGDSPPDCVVSDYDMPGRNGLEFLRDVRDEHPGLPFILFTGKGSEEVASEAISAGITDYLQKGTGTEQYQLLANRIRNAVDHRRSRDALTETTSRYRSLRTELIELSIELLQAEHTAVDDRIEQALGRIGDHAAADRSYVFRIDRGAGTVSNTHEWCADGVEPQIESLQELPIDAFAWWMERLDRFEPITISDVSKLPAEADQERRILGTQRISSLIVVPMVEGDSLTGFIGFDWLDTTDAWDDEFVDMLQITGRLITSTLRQESRQRELREYETVIESMSDAVYILDEDGRFTYVNDAFVELVGYDRETILGGEAALVKDAETVERAERQLGRLLSSDGPETVAFTATIRPRDGDPIVCEDHMGVLPYEGDSFRGSVGTLRDVTEREARAAEVLELKRQYQTLTENIPNGAVFLFDEDSQYVRARGTELEAVGMSPEAIEGATPHDIFPPETAEELARYYAAALDGTGHTFTQSFGEKTYRNRTIPVEDDDGSVVYGMALTQNVTDEVERRRQLEAQNERLEEFARVVSHDLRNPLQVADGRVELARADCESDHLDGAAAALDRAGALVDNLLTLAQGGDAMGNTEAVSVAELAANCWDVVPTADATLTVNGDQTLVANRSRFRQLLENLFTNAVEHGGAGVTVSVGALDDGFYVADDGAGIPEDKREDVFEVGYSTAGDGTGFGLRIVRQIAEAHGWALRVTDGEDGGARFEFTGVDAAE